ncbi:MAG: CvpA family protein [Phycisphaerales bacterium]|jgi:hypothetical protein
MTALVLLIIILACVAYQHLKGSLLGAAASVVITICSCIAAFAYFELLANLFITHAGSRFPALLPWVQSLCFILLFVIALAILQTIASKLIRKSVEFDDLPEKIGRCLCGAILGFILTGLLLTTVAMAPLPEKFPYRRFEPIANPQKPNKAMLNPDGFLCGLFGLVSRGSMSSKTSFAVIHPSLIDELFLNRHITGKSTPLLTEKNAISLPPKAAAWLAPDTLKNKDGTNITPKTGHTLTIVRVGIKPNGQYFTTAQLRLICKEKISSDDLLKGKAVNIYPVGYLSAKDRLETKQLNELISLNFSASTGPGKLVDFVFEVPDNYSPALVAFKQNSIAQVPKLINPDDAPDYVPF